MGNHLTTNTVTWLLGQAACAALIGVLLLVAVAYYTLAERKIMASIQRRLGPNVVGPWGLLQPVADGVKLLFKEVLVPSRASTFLFILSPYLTFVLSLLGWAVIPLGAGIVLADIPMSVLYFLSVSSLGIYGVLLAGWASNSRYAFMGSVRSVAQMVSYEIAMGFCLLAVCLCAGTPSLMGIVYAQAQVPVWYGLPLLPLLAVFFVSILAETNRAPFDLPEAEAELVSGYNTEYSAIAFALFFLGEYASMLLVSGVCSVLFLGGWSAGILTFAAKLAFFAYLVVLVRAILPRYRYDKLLSLGWKCFLPLTLGFFLFLVGVLCLANALPFTTELNYASLRLA